MPEVSIIVATYNADWQKLMMTINSIIIQSGVKFEIIFADDGSKIKWNDKIRRYLPDDIDGSFVKSVACYTFKFIVVSAADRHDTPSIHIMVLNFNIRVRTCF